MLYISTACHQLTLLTGGKNKFKYAYEGSTSPHSSTLHWNPLGFRKRSDTFLTEYYKHIVCFIALNKIICKHKKPKLLVNTFKNLF